jgi:hypothetical protein
MTTLACRTGGQQVIEIVSAILGYRRNRDFLLIIIMALFEGFFLVMPILHDADRRYMPLADAQKWAVVYMIGVVALNLLMYALGSGVRRLLGTSAASN